ncbi:unnamed protein product [Protopolystoma xenopodis]|uniref:Uncharacterized protein n=1 Tax=Protopolystoma xenopodis TaxID=117903 RepID=A0A448WHJ2_9PLAT|nr:unnamed protein product [Protopolystoma xenopodis]
MPVSHFLHGARPQRLRKLACTGGYSLMSCFLTPLRSSIAPKRARAHTHTYTCWHSNMYQLDPDVALSCALLFV